MKVQTVYSKIFIYFCQSSTLFLFCPNEWHLIIDKGKDTRRGGRLDPSKDLHGSLQSIGTGSNVFVVQESVQLLYQSDNLEFILKETRFSIIFDSRIPTKLIFTALFRQSPFPCVLFPYKTLLFTEEMELIGTKNLQSKNVGHYRPIWIF